MTRLKREDRRSMVRLAVLAIAVGSVVFHLLQTLQSAP